MEEAIYKATFQMLILKIFLQSVKMEFSCLLYLINKFKTYLWEMLISSWLKLVIGHILKEIIDLVIMKLDFSVFNLAILMVSMQKELMEWKLKIWLLISRNNNLIGEIVSIKIILKVWNLLIINVILLKIHLYFEIYVYLKYFI